MLMYFYLTMSKIPSVAILLQLLTLPVLAYWIMGDGFSSKGGGTTLCTDSFTFEEVVILREALETKFNIRTSTHKKKGKNGAIYPRIYLKKDQNLKNLFILLDPYILPEFKYKMSLDGNNKKPV